MLPKETQIKLPEMNTPTRWQSVILRNYGHAPVANIARVLRTSEETVHEEAARMGLPRADGDARFLSEGYITLIRNNWFLLPADRLCTLIGMTKERLAFALKEEDFLFAKLGNRRPKLSSRGLSYRPLGKRALRATERIAKTLSPLYKDGYGSYFDFFKSLPPAESVVADKTRTHMVHGYITPCAEPFLVDSESYLPDELLSAYAKSGTNALFIHGLLSTLSPYPFLPRLSKGYKTRREKLRALCVRAKKYGIGIYLYLNEPRGLPVAVGEGKPYAGTREGENVAICMETREGQEYLYTATKELLLAVPELSGFFTITMSENLTHCHSRVTCSCSRCKDISPEVFAARVNNIMMQAARDAGTGAEVIANLWAWSRKHSGWSDRQIANGIRLLDKEISVLSVSETDKAFTRGGIRNTIIDYSIAIPGPGPIARTAFRIAGKAGHRLYAKIQVSNSWECACAPYLPLFDLTATHYTRLMQLGVKDFLLTWTLGGFPSPSLSMVHALSTGKTLDEWYRDFYGSEAEAVHAAVRAFCHGFSRYPFDVCCLYYSPETLASANLWSIAPEEKRTAIVSFTFDDYENWTWHYGPDVHLRQMKSLLRGLSRGVRLLEEMPSRSPKATELLLFGRVMRNHFEAEILHTEYAILKRDFAANARKILRVVRKAERNTQELMTLRECDTRIGYEASNHYFYIKSNFAEKLLCLQRIAREAKRILREEKKQKNA